MKKKEEEPELCNSEVDFYDDGRIFACDREKDHPRGRHAYRGVDAILSWSE